MVIEIKLGTVKRGQDVGYKGIVSTKVIWHACEGCGKERWVTLRAGIPMYTTCRKCAPKLKRGLHYGQNNPAWKGGRHIDGGGYVQIKILPNDFFYSMVSIRGYIPEHRLVMAKHLGRCLHGWEIVHHKNHIKDDNRTENLQLVTDDRHKQITILENRINWLEKRVTLLEAENILLKQGNSLSNSMQKI